MRQKEKGEQRVDEFEENRNGEEKTLGDGQGAGMDRKTVGAD